jgi:hypothetical protein
MVESIMRRSWSNIKVLAKLEQYQSAGGISVGVSKCRFSERLYKKLPQSRGAALNFLQRVRVGDEGYPSVLVHLVR